ncbi:hypothetical protein HDU80_002384, partial [Chytriomyces hyalinus]
IASLANLTTCVVSHVRGSTADSLKILATNATHLTQLSLIRCECPSDLDHIIAPLTKLTSLDVSYNDQIASMDCVSSLIHLTELNCSHTSLENLEFCSNLHLLHSLDVGYTCVTDLLPLQNLASLQSLSIRSTEVENLQPLASLSLTYLDMSYIPSITDLSPLPKSLIVLLMNECESIKDFTPLSGIIDLACLEGMGNPDFTDVEILFPLKGLDEVHLTGTGVEDVGILKRLFPNLEVVKDESEYK